LEISSDEALSWVEPALTSMDFPNVDFIHKYFLSRSLADQSVEIALSGHGADSLFGCSSYHRKLSVLMAMQWIPESLRKALIHIVSPSLAKIISTSPKWDSEYLGLAMRRLIHDENFCPAGFPLTNWPLLPPNLITQKWSKISWINLFGHSLPTFLTDSISKPFCNRLEWRFPFLDHQLVEIVLRMPQRFHGTGNNLLRNAFKDLYLPPSLSRTTNYIDLPMSIWTRGPLRQLCSSRLEILKTTGIVDSSYLEQIWRAFELGQISWKCIWSLVILGELARREFNCHCKFNADNHCP
jgi:asparagine synthase (glutamine-hydrolysing)